MATTFRRFTKTLFLTLNILAAALYLLASLGPYLNPAKWWFISLLGFGLIFVFVTLIAFMFFWLVFRPRFIFISLVPLLIGFKGLTVFFAFHLSGKFDYTKQPNTLRVMHWNVARFVEWRKNNNKGSQVRQKMLDLIREQNADVLCMPEYYTSTSPPYYDNLTYFIKDLGYPYYYFSWDNLGNREWGGQVIFSRYPIIDSGIIRYPKPSQTESLIHVDLLVNKDTVRVYTTHLQSLKFKKQDYEKIEEIKTTKDGMVENSKSIFSKLKTGVKYRSAQAEILRNQVIQSPYPFILTGDFNDVPNSYAYYTVKDNDLQDAFLSKGFGIGRTYVFIAPTLRIDYILTTKDFEVKQFNRVVKNLSDHYMLVTDLVLKPGTTRR
jgi:endonuclease/exonuclease/phosphatase family metal-dependent hydrolase